MSNLARPKLESCERGDWANVRTKSENKPGAAVFVKVCTVNSLTHIYYGRARLIPALPVQANQGLIRELGVCRVNHFLVQAIAYKLANRTDLNDA